uniref:Putative heparin sulfate cell surface proteoglycan n=1 Tax=Xenopsylla cheopis TaxID=163159 RepID=A0A6M2E098_XENCH
MFTQSIRNAILFIFLILFDLHFCATMGVSELTCAAASQLLASKGLSASDIYQHPVNGSHLQICKIITKPSIEKTSISAGVGETCCSAAAEDKLSFSSKQILEQTIREILNRLSFMLSTKAQNFNDFFHDLLSSSKVDFHAMFRRTYGVIYEQNSYVFTDLFAELEKYYSRGNVDLTEAMENFFNILYQKMFTVLNSQYNFDNRYLQCVSDNMRVLKPFGDVPDKLSVQIKRSFIATRTYAHALNSASVVVKNMQSIKPTKACRDAVMKMKYCGICNGFNQKPCVNQCINVMNDCLTAHSNLDSDWNNFVAAMEKVSERLIGPFNIEMVVGPIDIKISEAIMIFQENGHAVSQQVFEKCGHPKLGRWKKHLEKRAVQNLFESRSDSDFEINFEAPLLNIRQKRNPARSRELELEHQQFPRTRIKIKNHAGNKQNMGRNEQKKSQNIEKKKINEGITLDKILKDIRSKVKDTSGFWSRLSGQICNSHEFAAVSSKDTDCWNGTTIERHLQPLTSHNTEFQLKNSKTPHADQEVFVEEQKISIKNLVAKLRNAYNGLDVEWPEYEDSYGNSGSGSGNDAFNTNDDENIQEESVTRSNNFNIDSDNIPNIYTAGDIPESAIDTNDLEIKTNVVNNNPNIHTNILNRPYLVNLQYDKTSNNSSKKTVMSLSRALIGYLLPIVVIWFGEMFAELL